MTQWNQTLNLMPEWSLAKNGTITVQQMAGVVAQRRRKLDFTDDHNYERDDIAEVFEDISADEEATTLDFDLALNELYDFGDTRVSGAFFDAVKLCWIKTC